MTRLAAVLRWIGSADWLIVGGLFVVAAVTVAWTFWAFNASLVSSFVLRAGSPVSAGQWGDSFGGFNALVGALGFSAVVATLFMQGRALARQQLDQYRQRFDQTFFELLRILRENRDAVRFKPSIPYANAAGLEGRGLEHGHAAFRMAFKEAQFWIERASDTRKASRPKLAALYFRRIHARYESTFGAYYRTLYAILERIRNADQLSEREKNAYGNLVRGQFTSFEAGLAGLNALMRVSKDFDTLVTRFRLLKYLRNGVVRSALERHFPEETFLGR